MERVCGDLLLYIFYLYTGNHQLFYDFINVTRVHIITVNAQDYLYLQSTFIINFYRNLASPNADNEMFSTVLLTNHVLTVQSLQPKDRE